MYITDKIFELQQVAPFDSLNDSELALIAEVSQVRHFEANRVVASPELGLQRLFICIQGSLVLSSGKKLPKVFGIENILFELPLKDEVLAGPEGVVCLVFSKGHFFTMIHECPVLVAGCVEGDSNLEPSVIAQGESHES